ncbi:MAG: Stk1 family PASTA domain-containing Ser/Thr kinase [Pseudoflavonifractor sp.]
MDQYIGKLLDNRYEIIERIGMGGMAVVYKARCHRLNRLVAIKILKSDLAQDAEFRRRFHDESQAVAMLSHPNIVAVYDVSRSTELDYIVMELIDGITLKQYMQKKGGPLNWREALHFITQIMKALSHAHGRGIIHRDIKPHNIMVLRDGSVKVADFGIARLTSAAQNTLTQEALGSVHYISPEQARGSHIDARSDIYSAGVVLYEMVTGRLPYEGDSPISVAIQHINSIPLAPREVNPEIPEALESIIMKAMSANVEQRYVSSDAMLADLEEFRKNPSMNFDFSTADLQDGTDEPTQIRSATGSHSLHGAVPIKNESEKAHARRNQDTGSDQGDEEDDYMDHRRGRSSDRGSPVPIFAAVGVILIFLVGIGYFLWVSFFAGLFNPSNETYTVPDLLTGMTIEEAQADTKLLGKFTVVLGKSVLDSTAPEGQIVNQKPKAGETVGSGSLVITVDVSGGNTYFKLEDYRNRPVAEIKALIESKGIIVALKEETSEEITRDFIIAQDPLSGTQVKPGETVTLTVSTGPKKKPVVMISLVGMPLDFAKEQIEKELGLLVGRVSEVYDEKQPVGNVVWQSTDATVEVPEKTVINLQVSKGPDPAAPSVAPSTDVPPSVPPSPAVTVPQPTMIQKAITVTLPNDRDIVHVSITVGGVEKYSGDVDTHFHVITPPVEGTGVQEVNVYIDTVLVSSQNVDFS